MKKRIVIAVVCVFCISLLVGFCVPGKKNVVAAQSVSAAESEDIYSAHFLNMLNHNFVYGASFGSYEDIVNGSVISQLKLREGDFIKEEYVFGFIDDMYGINIMSVEQGGAPKQDGYLYIVPMGFTRYTHSNPCVTENEDGSFTVITDVVIKPHDSESVNATAVSLFVKNEKSAFGFNLISSELDESGAKF